MLPSSERATNFTVRKCGGVIMSDRKPKQMLRFAAVLVVPPVYLGVTNNCLSTEFVRLPRCGEEGERTERQDVASHAQHEDAGGPTDHHSSGTANPCCTTLIGVAAPKFKVASTQPAASAAVVLAANRTLLLPVSRHGLRIIPAERPSHWLTRSHSAPRAPPLA